jgi:hypothetical protein
LSLHPVPSEAVDERPLRVRIDPPPEEPPKRPARLTRRGVIAFVALLAVTIVAAQSCQQSQVRLVRQGINARPFWAVSFSIPAADGDGYARVTTVRVDANTGTVEAVNRER